MEDVRDGSAVVRYIADVEPNQELLRQLLTQLAGYSLMAMLRDPRLAHCRGSLETAEATLLRSREGLRALAVPGPARHHHHHLQTAYDALGHAYASAEICSRPGATDGERDDLSRALRTATHHLRAATRLIPGAELADLGQACCAVHAATFQTEPTAIPLES